MRLKKSVASFDQRADLRKIRKKATGKVLNLANDIYVRTFRNSIYDCLIDIHLQ